MAANHTDCIVDKHEQKLYRTSNGLKIDPKEDGAASESKVETPPVFTLKDITIKAGTEQSILLGVTGQTEGYSIKSVAVEKNGSYHTKKFGIKLVKNQPISPTGLSITLTTNRNLKKGAYTFRMKIGKIGKGSKTTEQLIESMIHIIEDELKKEPQNGSCNDVPLVQALNNETLRENGSKNEQKYSPKKHTPAAQLNFTLENIKLHKLEAKNL